MKFLNWCLCHLESNRKSTYANMDQGKIGITYIKIKGYIISGIAIL